MATKAKSKPNDVKASAGNTLKMTETEGTSRERTIANVSLNPVVANAKTTTTFAKGIFGEIDFTEAVSVMREKVEKVKDGDLSGVEATLTAQAATLDAIFNEMARRAAQNMGTYINATEIYLRMALKAQGQCRATLETLAEVKYPKAPTFVRQQNVAYQQQVNNGDAVKNDNANSTHAHAHEKKINQSNELLEAQNGERLDTGTAATAGGNDSKLEAVEKVDGTNNNQR